MEPNKQQYCRHCDHPLRGRSDKKFCNDRCRNNYNNTKTSLENNLTRRIISVLRQNRRILREIFNESQDHTVETELLKKLGFQFEYHTESQSDKKEHLLYFCFEYAYQYINAVKIKISHHKNKL